MALPTTQEELDALLVAARAEGQKAGAVEGRALTLKALGFESLAAAEAAMPGMRAALEQAKAIPDMQGKLDAHGKRLKAIAERDMAGLSESAREAVKRRGDTPESWLDSMDLLREAGLGAAPKPVETQGQAGEKPPEKPGETPPLLPQGQGPTTQTAASASVQAAIDPKPAAAAVTPPPAADALTLSGRYDQLLKNKGPIEAGLFYQVNAAKIEAERQAQGQRN